VLLQDKRLHAISIALRDHKAQSDCKAPYSSQEEEAGGKKVVRPSMTRTPPVFVTPSLA
jgi:hypothetical protein